jgi:hypothetical protein
METPTKLNSFISQGEGRSILGNSMDFKRIEKYQQPRIKFKVKKLVKVQGLNLYFEMTFILTQYFCTIWQQT